VGELAPIVAAAVPGNAEQMALAGHPGLALADAEIAREEAELARLPGERRPDFVIGGGNMLRAGVAGACTPRGGLSWPYAPWARGRLTASIDTQTKKIAAVRARRESMAAMIRQDVRMAVVRLAIAERHVRLIESTVLPQVERGFDVARAGYRGGDGSFAEILESQRLLLAARLEFAEARAHAAEARAELDSAVGHHE
jgi:outer membrane protein TolC